jgi:hypothetical protein
MRRADVVGEDVGLAPIGGVGFVSNKETLD